MANDPYWNNVVLAMHMDDADLSDDKCRAVVRNGGISSSSALSKFGGFSALFDGVDDYLHTNDSDLVFGTGDFTIEFFAYVDGSVNSRYFIDFRPANTNGAYISLSTSATNTINFRHTTTNRIVGTQVVANGWHHIALSRASGTTRLFVDGVQDGSSYVDATSYGCGALRPRIGSGGYSTPESLFKGNIDDLRITKGVGRYTTNFSVPTEAFPSRGPQMSGTVKDINGDFAQRVVRAYRRSDGAFASQVVSDAITGAFVCPTLDSSEHCALQFDGSVAAFDPHWNKVVLAMHMDETGLIDSTGRHTISIGTASRSSVQSKYGGYSALFPGSDGVGVSVGGNLSDFSFPGDFTIEMWVYPKGFGAGWGSYLLATTDSGNTNGWMFTCGSASTANKFQFWSSADGASIYSDAAPPLSQWTHVAVVRRKSEVAMYVGGVKQAATLTTASVTPTAAQCRFGMSGNSASGTWINGHIDDVRVTKGVARYTENFTPPTAAFPHGPIPGAPSANAIIFDNITPV